MAGIEAQFYVENPVELRIVEALLEKGFGEREAIEKLIQAVVLGDVVYDIGASLGTHTIMIAKKVGENGRVIAFEPEAESFRKLKFNVSLNGLKNVMFIHLALGEKFSDRYLSSYGGGFGAFNLTGHGYHKYSEKVKIVPGDFFVQENRLPLPKVIKVDVEGYEFHVLRGLERTLSDKTCQVVCCEIHPRMLPPDIRPKDIIDLLKSYGFRQIEIKARGETFHVFSYKELAD